MGSLYETVDERRTRLLREKMRTVDEQNRQGKMRGMKKAKALLDARWPNETGARRVRVRLLLAHWYSEQGNDELEIHLIGRGWPRIRDQLKLARNLPGSTYAEKIQALIDHYDAVLKRGASV